MRVVKFELNEIERMCGVTLEDVAAELPRGIFRENDSVFVVSRNLGPALGQAVARCAFGVPADQVQDIGNRPLGRAYRVID